MDSGRFRRTIALTAAYAVALQMLLAAFVPLASPVSAGPFSVLCSHDKADGSGPPAQHDLPCAALCAAMGQGIAGSVPPDVVAVIAAPQALAALAPARDWTQPQIAPTDIHAPRGPPLA
jgi:hypothetical protein